MQYSVVAENGISDYYFCEVSNNYSQLLHSHSHIEFVFSLEGEAQITIDGKFYTLRAGETCIIMPYEVHNVFAPKYSEIFLLACPPDYISEYKQVLINNSFSPPHTTFRAATKNLISDIIDSDFKDDFKKKSLLYCALSELIQNSTLIKKESADFDLYRKAMAYIAAHYKKNLSLKTVSQQVLVTPAHLSRVINKRSKSSFTDIVNSLRIYEAKKLIEQENMSISDAAFEAGYGSIRNFNRIFKKHFGITPKEHIKKLRKC